jgi:small nuclear ribonucleoprotein (snRNP)-like protein
VRGGRLPASAMLFYSYFKTLVGKEVTVELKNDLAITGTLHSVDQYLNVKLNNVKVVNEAKYPHMARRLEMLHVCPKKVNLLCNCAAHTVTRLLVPVNMLCLIMPGQWACFKLRCNTALTRRLLCSCPCATASSAAPLCGMCSCHRAASTQTSCTTRRAGRHAVESHAQAEPPHGQRWWPLWTLCICFYFAASLCPRLVSVCQRSVFPRVV